MTTFVTIFICLGLLFLFTTVVFANPFKPYPERYTFFSLATSDVRGDSAFAITPGHFNALIEEKYEELCGLTVDDDPIDPADAACGVLSSNNMVCIYLYDGPIEEDPLLMIPADAARSWSSSPDTPQWAIDLLQECVGSITNNDLKAALFCNAGCVEPPERVCVGSNGKTYPLEGCMLDTIDINAYNEALRSTCTEAEHDECGAFCGMYEVPSSFVGWRYSLPSTWDGDNRFITITDTGKLFDTMGINSYSNLNVTKSLIALPTPQTQDFVKVFNDTKCQTNVEIYDLDLTGALTLTPMTFDTFQRLDELFEEIKITQVSPISGMIQNIYDVSHHKHQELPQMHCAAIDSCGIGMFAISLTCRRILNSTSSFMVGSNVEWCRNYLETLLPSTIQNPSHQLSKIITVFDDSPAHRCISYGTNACSTLNDLLLDAKYYWKCRVYGTSEYSREACNVQYCPWPLCQMSGVLTNGNENNNNNNNQQQQSTESSLYIPPFVKSRWSNDNSTLLDYSMQRDVQCVLWDEAFMTEIVLPNYICEETLTRSHHFNLDDLTTYYCNETSFLIPTTNSTSGDDDDTAAAVAAITTTTTTTTGATTQIQTSTTSSFYTAQIDNDDGPTSKCCTNFKFGPNCDKFAEFTNIGIEWLNSTYSIKNVTTLKIPDQPQDDPSNFYLTTSNLFLLYWDYYGPLTRYAHVYVNVFTTTNQNVPVFEFPILLGRVAAGARGFTFPFDQKWFKQLFSTQKLTSNFFQSITKFNFKIISSTNVIGEYEIPVQFGCARWCLTGCDVETGECTCGGSYTTRSHCLFDMCDQVVPRLSEFDTLTMYSRFNSDSSQITFNWAPCNAPLAKERGSCLLDDTKPNGRICSCTHDMMEFNAPLWTAADRQIPVTSADMTKFYNRPNCDVFARCEDDDILNGVPKCLNGGYHPAIYNPLVQNTICEPTCACPNAWGGERCEKCTLNCIHGKPNDDCTKCICDIVPSDNEYRQRMPSSLQLQVPHLTYFGEQCQFTRLFTTSITFNELPPWYMQSQQSVDKWHAAILDDIMADSGIGGGEIHFTDAIEETKGNNNDKTLEVWYDIIINDKTTSDSTTIPLKPGDVLDSNNDGGLKQGLEEYQLNLTSIKLALKISKMQKEKEEIVKDQQQYDISTLFGLLSSSPASSFQQQKEEDNNDNDSIVSSYNQMLVDVIKDFENKAYRRQSINNHLSTIKRNQQHQQHISIDLQQDIISSELNHHYHHHVLLSNQNVLFDALDNNNTFNILQAAPSPSPTPSTSANGLTLYEQWKKLQEQMEQTNKQQQENPTTYDPTNDSGYLINDLPLEGSTTIPIVNTPQEIECISIYLPGCSREDVSPSKVNIIIAIAVPVVIVVFFLIFLVILFWCKKNQKGFFAPKQKKKRRKDLEMSSTASLTICPSCQKTPTTTTANGQSTVKSASGKSVTKSSVSHRFKCESCKHEYNYDASTGESLPIGLSEAAMGDEIDTGEILPVGWVVMRDKASGKNYYYHEKTMTTRWNHPNDNSTLSPW